MIYDTKSDYFRRFLVAYAAYKHKQQAMTEAGAGPRAGPAAAHVPKPTGPSGSV